MKRMQQSDKPSASEKKPRMPTFFDALSGTDVKEKSDALPSSKSNTREAEKPSAESSFYDVLKHAGH